MTILPLSFPGTLTKAQLEQTLIQKEPVNGPLVKIEADADGKNTIMSFDTDEDPPKKTAALDTYTGANPPAKVGFSILLTGSGIVEGKKAQIVVYRAN